MRLKAGLLVALVIGCGESSGADSDSDGGTETDGSESGGSMSGSAGPGSSADTAMTSSESSAESSTDPTNAEGPESGDPPIECDPPALDPGMHTDVQISFAGDARNYHVYVPEAVLDGEALPLVLNFHGFTSNAGQQSWFSQMDQFAEEAGVIVAYPNGISNSWNGGACCGAAASGNLDDVGFARAVVDEVASQLCVDPSRIYATGMSNGGFMSYRLACEASDLFAAIAPVAGVIGIETCEPERPVPVMHFHGTADPLVPYGGGALGFSAAPDSVGHFTTNNGCASGPEITFEEDNVICETWTDCDAGADTTLCTIEGGGHCWFGNPFCPTGLSTEVIHASQAALDFFAQHTL